MSTLTAYSVKLKKKVPILNPKVIETQTKHGTRFRIAGVDQEGNKVTTFVSKATAEQYK